MDNSVDQRLDTEANLVDKPGDKYALNMSQSS